jgi:hypothetical protein
MTIFFLQQKSLGFERERNRVIINELGNKFHIFVNWKTKAFAKGKRDECVWQHVFFLAIYCQKEKLNINSNEKFIHGSNR